MVPEILMWSPSREASQMVPGNQDDPSDPRMVAKLGGTLVPNAQGWTMRPQGGPQAGRHLWCFP